MCFTKFALALVGASTLATAAIANPITLDASNVGQSYFIGFDGYTEGRTIEGLTGQATFTLTGVADNAYTFNYSISNTSSAPIDASRISIFGFNTDPNISSATATGMFDQAHSGNVPSGFAGWTSASRAAARAIIARAAAEWASTSATAPAARSASISPNSRTS